MHFNEPIVAALWLRVLGHLETQFFIEGMQPFLVIQVDHRQISVNVAVAILLRVSQKMLHHHCAITFVTVPDLIVVHNVTNQNSGV